MGPKMKPGIRKTKGSANISPLGGQHRMPTRIVSAANTSKIQPSTLSRFLIPQLFGYALGLPVGGGA
jgi:hypothetical protein